MATRKQVEELKRQWSSDPCWDIEETTGFSKHRQELLIYRLEVENNQMRRELNKIHELKSILKEVFS